MITMTVARRSMLQRFGLALLPYALVPLVGAVQWLPYPQADYADTGADAAAIVVPLLAVIGLGEMRPRTLVGWLAVAAILCFGLGWHWQYSAHPIKPLNRIFGEVTLMFTLAGLLGLGHCLVAAADVDRRWIGRYETCFDVATLLGVRALLVLLLFVLAVASLSSLGMVVLILAPVLPALTLAASAAFPGIARRLRDLLLVLLNWFAAPALLVASLVLLAVSLCQGWRPRWVAGDAETYLLAALVIVILIASLSGPTGHPVGRFASVLRVFRIALVLVLLAALAIAAEDLAAAWRRGPVGARTISLTGWWGWAAFCAAGYVVCAARSGLAMRGLPLLHIATVLLGLLLATAMLTPLADPDRLAVAWRVPPLEAGATPPYAFDYGYLGMSGGYGYAALKRLATLRGGPNADEIARRAKEALKEWFPYDP
ncbi:MAG TPA: hypothetical protein VMI56_06870 [Reyranella sp.]|nr:hypothetical protein [Reyranella sp.]